MSEPVSPDDLPMAADTGTTPDDESDTQTGTAEPVDEQNDDQNDDQNDAAQVVCGDWWEDGWMSPYLRANFRGLDTTAGEVRLIVKAFNPAATGAANRMIVRIGAEVFKVSDPVATDSGFDLDEPLPAHCLKDGQCSISLRAERAWTPSGGDQRNLGFVLIDWRLES